ncbi:methylated-DNA--[protein]-cysteine S-methyltransferase [Rhodobacteraceae bacterium CCMM004]|nr:methylated-DNA--[protein]-cysteine S-methyltransferase [Rhodobacteraceae bacterium CCMM004]
MSRATVASPLGPLTLTAAEGGVTRLAFGGAAGAPDDPLLSQAAEQIAAYFAGTRRTFDLPLAPAGSVFERAVWAEMRAITWGETRTYGDLGLALGAPARAVGQACGTNPLPILIPCHRILAADGLGGYSGAGGVETKVTLLRHEGAAGLLL